MIPGSRHASSSRHHNPRTKEPERTGGSPWIQTAKARLPHGSLGRCRQILFKIIFPLSLPAIVVAGIFAFLLGWNDVLFASIFARPDIQTAAVALQVFGATQGVVRFRSTRR